MLRLIPLRKRFMSCMIREMVEFNEEKQQERVGRIREREEEDLARILSQKYGLGYQDLTVTPINPDGLRLLPEKQARDGELVVFDAVGKDLVVGVRSPNNPKTQAVLDDLKERGYNVVIVMVSSRSLESAWTRYQDISYATESKRGSLDISSEDIATFTKKVQSLSDVTPFIQETLSQKRAYRTSHIVEAIVASAIALKASDIHVEPEENHVRLRFRLDGILTNVSEFDTDTYALLLSRIKLLSGLKLNIKGTAQDGRFSIDLNSTDVEIRTSVLPGEYGESIVLRILNPDATRVSIETIGLHPKLLEIVRREIKKPNGMILTTGPTGSGKTTALYSFLKSVHKPEIKIITIEDPIEYHLPGIVQTQVDPKKDYTFASGLRSALRQDPDVMMVGEIRDGETAEIAINAALTGHIVFSTLHTNNAAGTFPRLIDLGVSSKTIGSALSLTLAQRLVRQLCASCKQQKPLEASERVLIEKILSDVVDTSLLDGVQTEHVWVPGSASACIECGGLGYKDRIAIFEGILTDEAVDEAVRNYPSERDVWRVALPQGIPTMPQDGIFKVLSGITSLEELGRVVDLSASYIN